MSWPNMEKANSFNSSFEEQFLDLCVTLCLTSILPININSLVI
jgi:hypothetical protein